MKSTFNYRSHMYARPGPRAHTGVKQRALIKHSHYTQEEIPAGAVYWGLVHFLLLLRPPASPPLYIFFLLCTPGIVHLTELNCAHGCVFLSVVKRHSDLSFTL